MATLSWANKAQVQVRDYRVRTSRTSLLLGNELREIAHDLPAEANGAGPCGNAERGGPAATGKGQRLGKHFKIISRRLKSAQIPAFVRSPNSYEAFPVPDTALEPETRQGIKQGGKTTLCLREA